MKFWTNNRLDAEFDLPAEQVAAMFAESDWAEVCWPIDRRLRAFLTEPAGPIGAVWDDQHGYDQLVDLILTHRHNARRAARP